MADRIRDHAVTTLDDLIFDIREALLDLLAGGAFESVADRLLLSSREYAAAQVEAHARGPYRTRRERLAAGQEQRGGMAS